MTKLRSEQAQRLIDQTKICFKMADEALTSGNKEGAENFYFDALRTLQSACAALEDTRHAD